jgi:hypothetical protein
MGKPSSGGGGGGGGGSTIFTSSFIGPPPGGLTVGLLLWVDLGVIPTGFKLWFGLGKYSCAKACTFQLRSNIAGQSVGTDGATQATGAAISTSSRATNVTADYYKSGSLVTQSVVGTGTERMWLKITSKSSTATNYLYNITYTSV